MAIDLWPTATRIAREEGVDPALFRALVRAESGGNQNAVSSAGARGYTQLLPATAKGLGVNPDDPEDNLRGGARYLAQQLKAHGGNVQLGLAAYNAGPGNVKKYGGVPPFAETQAYIQRVVGYAKEFPGGGKGVGAGQMQSQSIGVGSQSGAPNRDRIVEGLLESQREFTRTGKFRTDIMTNALLNNDDKSDMSMVTVGKGRAAGRVSVPAGNVGDPERALRHTMKVAKERFGLHIGENSLYGNVNPDVHVDTSNHYQQFKGSKTSRAADISGAPDDMMAFTQWVNKSYGNTTRELFHDPWGGRKGTQDTGAIGGHDKHVHVAF